MQVIYTTKFIYLLFIFSIYTIITVPLLTNRTVDNSTQCILPYYVPYAFTGILDTDARNNKRGAAFSYTQSEGYNNNLFDCHKLRTMKVKHLVASGFNSIMYSTQPETGKFISLFQSKVTNSL